MKELLNSILILSCAGVFRSVLTSPIESGGVPGEPYVQYIVQSSVSETEIEETFDNEKEDDCVKATIALYKMQQNYLHYEMEEACTPINKYSKFLESDFTCDRTYFIRPAMALRDYICTKRTDIDDYCDRAGINTDIKYARKNTNHFCSKDTSETCKKAYIKFANSLNKLDDPKLNYKSVIKYHTYNSNNNKLLIETLVYGDTDEFVSGIERKCHVDSSTTIVNPGGKCGTNIGICPDGECCSEYGYCGTSSSHCDIAKGCQSEFGKCNGKGSTSVTTSPSTTTKTSKPTVGLSKNGKCGPKDGTCPSGECCSKYGYCGTSSKHCTISEGCQSEFGKCNGKSTVGVSKNGKCGPKEGTCPSGECCSKYSYCGTSDKHCAISQGCQSEFGKCNGKDSTSVTTSPSTTKKSTPTNKDGKCGPNYGNCSSGNCCSKHGWCGKSSLHCDVANGCQSEFGHCN